jgi:hypothetical protein
LLTPEAKLQVWDSNICLLAERSQRCKGQGHVHPFSFSVFIVWSPMRGNHWMEGRGYTQSCLVLVLMSGTVGFFRTSCHGWIHENVFTLLLPSSLLRLAIGTSHLMTSSHPWFIHSHTKLYESPQIVSRSLGLS